MQSTFIIYDMLRQKTRLLPIQSQVLQQLIHAIQQHPIQYTLPKTYNSILNL